MDSVYIESDQAAGGREPKVGSSIHWNKKASYCVLIKVQKGTCQAVTVVDSRSAALLVRYSSTVYPIVDCHEFIMSYGTSYIGAEILGCGGKSPTLVMDKLATLFIKKY